MPARKITALVGPLALVLAMKTDRGSRMATPLVPPRPGNTPITSPRKQAMSSSTRLYGWAAVAKPPARLPSVSSITASDKKSQVVEHALRQAHAESELEHEIDGD